MEWQKILSSGLRSGEAAICRIFGKAADGGEMWGNSNQTTFLDQEAGSWGLQLLVEMFCLAIGLEMETRGLTEIQRSLQALDHNLQQIKDATEHYWTRKWVQATPG